MSERLRRLAVLKKACKKAGADFALITNFNRNASFFWLTNCAYGNYFCWDFSGRPRLLATALEESLCRKAWIRCEILDYSGFEEFFASLSGKAAIDGRDTNAVFYEKLRKSYGKRPVDISASLEKARSVKSAYEIMMIRKACRITKDVFSYAEKIQSGKTELQIFSEIRKDISLKGLEEAFEPIVASGSNIKNPHHAAEKKRLKGALLIDAGVRFRGYCSDVTRTYNSRYADIGNNIHEALESKIYAGASCRELDAEARRIMGNLSKHFITSLGHGVGVAVHEIPRISSKSSDVLRKNNVITIEPGIYVKNGMRLENVYLAKKNSCMNLTDW